MAKNPSLPLRQGYTTGACAAAAAGAATRALLSGRPVTAITLDLPGERPVTFSMCRCEFGPGRVTCGTIKDAGDDPDVTHGTEIRASVAWQAEPGITLAGGEGVGVVTKPGLPVAVGEPAINPVPRRMILQAVEAEAGPGLYPRGLQVIISVPDGARLAEATLNPRLGIVGGISILGTTGVVKPYSQSAYRASIYVELKVAARNGVGQAVLTTGNRSEAYARARYPDWPELGFVQVGDHMDYALRQVRRLGFPHVVIAGMIGKISKLAQGRMQTHVSEGRVDMAFLAGLAAQLPGAGQNLVEQVHLANTAHHVQIILRRAGLAGLETRLARLAAGHVSTFLAGQADVDVLLYDLHGDLLAVGRPESAGRE